MAPCRSSTHKKTWPSHLGHNSIQTTSIYVRAEKRWLVQALDRYYDRGDNKADSLAKVDGPIDVIQKLLGHEFLQTTSIYVRAEKKRMMEATASAARKIELRDILQSGGRRVQSGVENEGFLRAYGV